MGLERPAAHAQIPTMDALTTLAGAALVLATAALVVAAWLWGPWRRAGIRRQPFPPAWREILRRRMPAFARLPADVQLRLKKHAQVLIAEKPFIGCAGLVVTEEMRVLVAVQASLLLLGRGPAAFDHLRQILLYPGAFAVQRSQPDGLGLVHEQRQALLGEAWQQGQVLLSWNDVLAGAADPNDGHNVVIHEFAHVLDQAHGAANGAPWLPGRAGRERWARVMQAEFDRLQTQLANGEMTLLDPYGAQNAAEFFAVACEAFFEKPVELASQQAPLYALLQSLFGVDPALWRSSHGLARN
jgi:Mlc titration factor MtfA (ptsG expression regulator)